MNQVKDTERASVRIGYDGKVHKVFRGHLARERFNNEVRILQLCSIQSPLLPQAPLQLLRQLHGPGQILLTFAHAGGDEYLRDPDTARHITAGGVELFQLQVPIVLGHRLAVAREIKAGWLG
jgi:hypothetical protein